MSGTAAAHPAESSRVTRMIVAAVLLAEAVAATVLVARSTPNLLPVVMTAGSTSFTVAQVDVGVGGIVPLVLGALLLWTRGSASRRLRWVESSLSASIMVFLLAELNGIRELGALVGIYALTSAAVLFAALQDGRTDRPRMLPASFGAMVGIVPWGLIAWYEIAPAAIGDAGPGPWVRVLTVVVLALFIVAAVFVWRGSGGSRSAIVVSAVTRSVFAGTVAVAVAAGLTFG